MAPDDPLVDVHRAVERGQWRVALDALDALGANAATADGLELRARAAYGHGDLEASVQAWEDLHALCMRNGEHGEAARAAAMIAMFLMIDTGLMAPVRGWLRRAERLLEQHGDTPVHALIAMVRAYERFMCGDMDATRLHATRAIELGEALDVPPAVVIGRVAFARTEIYAGRVERGLELLDEVGAHLMSGVVDPLTTGMMYCELICAAQGLARFDMAREWTEVMEHWRHGAAIGGIDGRCRVHRAELLRISGPCDTAEEAALDACEHLRPWMRREFGWPLAELGNIRLRKGDLDGAEEAFVAAHGNTWSPHPGLALVQLRRGDVQGARELIADAIAHPIDVPSKERPPFGDLRLAPLLDAQSEIAHAAGDAETAQRSADALRSIADTYHSPALEASASIAAARAALVSGDLELAVADAESGLIAWSDVESPFDSAVARVVLAEVHQRMGNRERARMERVAARATFDAFGARGWTDHVDRLLVEDIHTPVDADPVRSDPSTATFICDGDTRTVCFGGRTVMIRDLKGLRYLARLLAEPGREFHVLDLVAVEHGTLSVGHRTDTMELDGTAGAGTPVLDQMARDAYRRRLAEVDEDIEEAARMNDTGRLDLAQRDRDFLIAELTSAVGLGGRARTVGSTAERARTSVTRSLRYGISRLAEHHGPMAAHLRNAVRTGVYCSYTPDPLTTIAWKVE